jgi:hypothetical protein
MSLSQYEAESKTQAITNLYLASLMGPQKALYDLTEEQLKSDDIRHKTEYLQARSDLQKVQ